MRKIKEKNAKKRGNFMPKKKKPRNEERQVILQEKKNNEVVAKGAGIFFVIITAFYPLFIWLSGYIYLTREKTFFYWIITAVSAAVMVALLFAAKGSVVIKNYYAEDEPARRVSAAEWALLAFIAWAFVSAAVSAAANGYINADGHGVVWHGASTRYEGFISYLCYAAGFIIIARYYKPKRLHFLLLAGSAVLISAYGVAQFLGLDILGLFPYERMYQTEGIPLYGPLSAFFRTTLGNVNIVSAYCSFAVVLFAGLYAVSRSKWQYLYLGAGIAAFALSLTTGYSGDAHKVAVSAAMVLLVPYWTADRERTGKILIILSGWCLVYAAQSAYLSAMKRQYEAGEFFPPRDRSFLQAYAHKNITLFIILAAVLLAAGLCLLLLLKKWPGKPMKIAGIIFVPVLMIGGMMSLELVGARLSPDNFIWQAREMMHGRLEDNFGSGRGWIWKNAVSVIPDNPVFGTGPDTFEYALGYDRQMEAVELFNVKFDKAHNIFLQIAVCMGIPALTAFLIFLGGVFVPAVKKAFERPLLLAFGGASLSYAIQSFFCVEVPITTPLFWIALGVMASEVWMARVGAENIDL